MQNTKIVFTAPKVVEVLHSKVPVPTGEQVVVQLMVSTISSGTERATLVGDKSLNPWEKPTEATYPNQVGYSSAGVVYSVGDAVTDLKVGDRVALVWSNHSKYCLMPRSNVYKLEDDNISFSEAALCCIGTFPLAAIRKCHFEIGESAIVMGMGVLGVMGLLQLKAAGAAPIIAADPIREKRELALKLGADYALDPLSDDFAEKVKEVTRGGVKVAIEVTGFGSALDQVLDCMAKFGRVALLGCTRNSDFTIDYYRKVHAPGVVLYGAHTLARPTTESSSGLWTMRDDMLAQFNLLLMNRLNYKQLVNEVHSPLDAPEVYTRLANDKHFPIVQFDWSKIE